MSCSRWFAKPLPIAQSAIPRSPFVAESARLLTPRAFRVLFVSDTGTQSHRYRVGHYVEALGRAGIVADVVERRDLAARLPRIPLFDLVVVVRLPSDHLLDELYRRCRRANVPTVYDVDDLVFEPDLMRFPFVDALRFLSSEGLVQYRDAVPRYRRALLDADACSAPTEFLADRCRQLAKEAIVLRNGLGADLSAAAERATSDETVRFGYFSGTQTHQRDFATVVGALARTMTAHPNVHLVIVGAVDFSEYPELLRFLSRVEHRPLVPSDVLPAEMARIDVNLAPLETGNPYCEAKSELKYLDAAAAGVPTIASTTGAFRGAITHGETGFLAATPADWDAPMRLLATDAELRRRVGQAARDDVARRYTPRALGIEARRALGAIVAAVRARRGIPDDALSLAVVMPPYARDPARERSTLAIACALAERGHEVRLFVHGAPDAVERAKHELWEDGYLGLLRFGGGTADLVCCDAIVATSAATSDVVRAHRGLAAQAFQLGAGDAPADGTLRELRYDGTPAGPDAGAVALEASLRRAIDEGGTQPMRR